MAARQTTLFLLSAVLVSIWTTVYGQECASRISCGACLNTAGCAWCVDESYTGARCRPPGNLTDCEFIEDAESRLVGQVKTTIIDGLNATIDTEVVRLALRVGSPQEFVVTVTPQRNLPLDLYILIDLSGSMGNELDEIRTTSGQIADRIISITNNVRLGFGSFNEKVLRPFAEERLDPSIPFDPTDINADRYAFRHTVNLTNDTAFFAEAVRLLGTTANDDFPENGLEGLAQVITCEDIIGWRSRENGEIVSRVVLFLTDQEFHYAGEGRLAGIINPYNGTCLLEPNPEGGPVELTAFDEIDYPSVGQILELLRQYDVTTIFAIQEDHMRSYAFIADTILNSNNQQRAVVAGFDVNTGSTGFLNLIENEYRRLLQSVALDLSNVTTIADVSISVEPTCPDAPSVVRVGDACSNVPLEMPVSFNVIITLNSCTPSMDRQQIRHTVTSPSFGSFELELDLICNCECARDTVFDPDSCSGMGVQSCSVCECNEGKCGVNCNQTLNDRVSLDCPVGRNGMRCSGRGMCDCNCICDVPDDSSRRIFGPACECDTFSCRTDEEDRLCSGRGMCCDEMCMCGMSEAGNQYRHDPDELPICSCEPLEEVCIDPITDTLCNGRGICGCNFCMCTDPQYAGTFCDVPNVDTCNFPDDEMCIKECRDSFIGEQGLPDICNMCNEQRPVIFVDRSDIMESEEGRVRTQTLENITNLRLGHTSDGKFSFVRGQCEYMDGNCITDYYILSNETHFALIVVREQECRAVQLQLPFPVWALAPIIFGALLILGILLLVLIKIIFIILDYIEVKKWQKEAGEADFSKNTNPLYQSPEMKYENVAYGRE